MHDWCPFACPISTSLQVARSAELVATIEEGYHLPGGDNRWFLD